VNDIRIGTAEREAAVSRLQGWFASGHLDETEMGERISAALQARTQEDLDRQFRQLPVPAEHKPLDRKVSFWTGVIWAGIIIGTVIPVAVMTVNSGHGMGAGNSVWMALAIAVGVCGIIGGIFGIADVQGDQDERIASLTKRNTELNRDLARLQDNNRQALAANRELRAIQERRDERRRNREH
jgi:hypothetical protein